MQAAIGPEAANFNSSVVRLEEAGITYAAELQEFQFLCGTIGSQSPTTPSEPAGAYFNSSVVRLEALRTTDCPTTCVYFNSSVVRLEAARTTCQD